jgi:hypothetical protein
MLINASTMFEFHMLVVVIVMLNILELIMKIVCGRVVVWAWPIVGFRPFFF